MDGYSIAIDDPRGDDVRALLEEHLAFAQASTPAEYIHALDLHELLDPSITFFSLRLDGTLLGIGALKELDPQHAEIKSMHTSSEARRQGVGRAIVAHLLAVAAARGHRRVSLETGTTDAFEPARRLYAEAGFVPCEPFGNYSTTLSNFFMTRAL